MKPPVETIRISKQGRDQLLKLKRHTRIENWNVLCRWALCVSLRDKSPPPGISQKSEGGIEMTWKVFAGEYSDILAAMCWLRAREEGQAQSAEGVAHCLRAHLHRGLAHLAAGNEARSLSDLVNKWFGPSSDHQLHSGR